MAQRSQPPFHGRRGQGKRAFSFLPLESAPQLIFTGETEPAEVSAFKQALAGDAESILSALQNTETTAGESEASGIVAAILESEQWKNRPRTLWVDQTTEEQYLEGDRTRTLIRKIGQAGLSAPEHDEAKMGLRRELLTTLAERVVVAAALDRDAAEGVIFRADAMDGQQVT